MLATITPTVIAISHTVCGMSALSARCASGSVLASAISIFLIRLTDKQRLRAGIALFPTHAHKRRPIIFITRVTYAKVTDELPRFGHIQYAPNNIGLEDRNPSDAHPTCACSEPEHADSHYRGIL